MSNRRYKGTGLEKFIGTLIYIREHPDCTAKSIQLDTGLAYSTIQHHVEVLLKFNFIYKTYEISRGNSYREMTEQVKEEMKRAKEHAKDVEAILLFGQVPTTHN